MVPNGTRWEISWKVLERVKIWDFSWNKRTGCFSICCWEFPNFVRRDKSQTRKNQMVSNIWVKTFPVFSGKNDSENQYPRPLEFSRGVFCIRQIADKMSSTKTCCIEDKFLRVDPNLGNTPSRLVSNCFFFLKISEVWKYFFLCWSS